MSDTGQTGRLLYAIGVGLFGVALVAGVIESLRINGRLPAIDLLANGSEAYINQLLARNNDEEAIEQLEIQLRIVPYDADTHERLGKLLNSQGRREEARDHFQELVRLKPGYAEGYCFLGFTYIDLNQSKLATGCFAEAIRLNPQFPKAIHGMGVALVELGELAEAEKCFAKVVELSPNSREAQTNLDTVRQELKASLAGVKKGEPGTTAVRPRN